MIVDSMISTMPPTTPAFGQLWYDDSVGQVKVFDGSGWISAESVTASRIETFDTFVLGIDCFAVSAPEYSSLWSEIKWSDIERWCHATLLDPNLWFVADTKIYFTHEEDRTLFLLRWS